MHTPAVTIDVYDAVGPLVAEWNALAERAAAPPFAHAGWFSVWWEAFGVGAPVIVGVRRGGRLVGVLALRRRGGILASAANAHTPEFRMLVEDAAAADELATWLFAQRPTRVQFVAGEDVDRRMTGKAVRNLRRNLRRLREHGAVEFDVVDAADDLDALLMEGFPLEASGWKSERGTAILSSPVTARFYSAVAHWARDSGLLRLGFLRLDGRAIAFALCLRDRTACYLIKGGYDPRYRRFAPAKSLIRHLISRSAREGGERFEFLGAAEPWKLEWTDRCHERLLVRTYAPTALGSAGRAAETVYLRYGKPLAKRALARVR
jgi:CelD/BcsL family acetyltransferase involved in cellulose biosynthesis